MTEADPLQQSGRTHIVWRGRKLLYFAGCDYFRLSRHPEVVRATRRACREIGLNVSASRCTTGNHIVYQTLERALAAFFRAPAAVLLPTGYMGDLAVAQALSGHFTHALIDVRSHGCLGTAARLLACPLITFAHRNAEDLACAIQQCGPRSRILILTDGMFSHDGSAAPLREYLALLPAEGMILVDDAHGAGVLGKNGRGVLEQCGVDRRRIIQTITLSKALGAYGGAVLATRELRDKIMGTSNGFAGATPVPLPFAAAARVSLQLLSAHPEWRARLFENADFVKTALRVHGIPLPETPGPIIPLPVCSPTEAAQLRRALLAEEIFPSFIHYPGGPASGYYRFVLSSAHTRQHLRQLTAVLIKHVPQWTPT
jgi:7-keto-8-aminopelargonate synthetase-like enzyme